jgi:hypothetical protein
MQSGGTSLHEAQVEFACQRWLDPSQPGLGNADGMIWRGRLLTGYVFFFWRGWLNSDPGF